MKRDYSDHEDRHAGTSSYASGYNGSCAGSSAGTSRHIGHTRSEAEELKYQGDALKQVLCTLYLPRMEHAQVSYPSPGYRTITITVTQRIFTRCAAKALPFHSTWHQHPEGRYQQGQPDRVAVRGNGQGLRVACQPAR